MFWGKYKNWGGGGGGGGVKPTSPFPLVNTKHLVSSLVPMQALSRGRGDVSGDKASI